MTVMTASFIWLAVAAYLGLGGLVAVAAATVFMRRLEPYGAPVPFHVRLLLVPGMIALWPVIVARIAGRKPVEDRS